MINISNKNNCCGCYACYNICPQNCIEMITDSTGFDYPNVIETKCTNCNLCQNVCPMIVNANTKNNPTAYAVINSNTDERLASSSGGTFSLLAKKIINSGGVVFGAKYDNDFNVVHTCIEQLNDVSLLRGAKYSQSKIKNNYKLAKKYLDNEQNVLFSGTPCQIAGFLTYLQKPYANLYTQDIICHSVPSPMVWQKYLKYIRQNKTISNINLRDKSTGWNRYSTKIDFSDTSCFSEIATNTDYMKGFINGLYSRPSCYNCKFKSLHRQSDITLADFWGIDAIEPSLNDNKGTSLIFLNSLKGQNLFNNIINDISYKTVDVNKSVAFNPAATTSITKHKKSDYFYEHISEHNFSLVTNHCLKKGFLDNTKDTLRKSIYKIKNRIKNL